MGSYNRNDRSSRGGSRRFGGSSGGFRRRDSGDHDMHSAVCDECGKDCKVPFKPSGDKPIYCSECFEKRDGGNSRGSSRRSSGRPPFDKRDDTNKKLLEQATKMNEKLDRILSVIESGANEKKSEKKTPAKKVKKKTTISKTKDKKED